MSFKFQFKIYIDKNECKAYSYKNVTVSENIIEFFKYQTQTSLTFRIHNKPTVQYKIFIKPENTAQRL